MSNNHRHLCVAGAVAVLILLITTNSVRGQESEDAGNAVLPKFITRGGTFRAVIGDTIVLPCKVDNLGRYTLVWKRGNAVLTAGDMKVTVEPRIHLVDGFNLEIRKVRIHDAGDYICQLSTLTPDEEIYTLEILVPPSVRSEPNEDHVTLTKGDAVTLQCRGTGNPVPIITWTRKNNILPNGEESTEGNTFHITKADRHQAGIYVCSANNGVGLPVSTSIHVKVHYAPDIDLEKNWIHSGDGHEAELTCIVHAEPAATVKWYRDSMLLDVTDRTLFEERGTRHSLIIRLVQATDFGNYTCVADNKLGTSKRHIEFSGKPNRPLILSDPSGFLQDSFNISWSVESFSPILESHLSYRIGNVNETHNIPGEWIHIVLPTGDSGQQQQPLSNSIIIPTSMPVSSSGEAASASVSSSGVQFESSQIRNLAPDKSYDARVSVVNKYGMSHSSEIFSFHTARKDSIRSFESSLKHVSTDLEEVNGLGMAAATSGNQRQITTRSVFMTIAALVLLQVILID